MSDINSVSAHKLDPERAPKLLEGRNNFRQLLTDMKQLYINNQSELSTTGLALSHDEHELFTIVCNAMDELIERLEREVTSLSKQPTTKSCPRCGQPMTYEPADPNYGADADGNRGVYMPAVWICENLECDQPDIVINRYDQESDH